MKILFITQVVPFPVRGGESLRSSGLLNCLLKSGHELYFISPMSSATPGLEEHFPGAQFIPYVFSREKESRISQFTGYFKRDKNLLQIFNDILGSQHIDLAIIDYFLLGQYISFFKRYGIPVIYGTHNAQSRLRRQQPAKHFMEKTVRLFSFLAQAWHERIYFKRADQLICVSAIDREFYARFMPKEQISIIPNFVDESSYIPSIEKKSFIIMTGNFDSFQNYYGLLWFLDDVWNEDLEEMTELYLSGKGVKEVFSVISKGRNFRRVKVIDKQEDILQCLASASAAVVPIWHGSGTRLKCIEAMALKTQLISTSIGAEGIDHEGSILIADTPGLFRTHIKAVLSGETNHTEKAYRVFRNTYSSEINRERLEKIIMSCVT
jgi:polysaccharide biosynthesis protein PslH